MNNMETKTITIPFDIELAKKIQAGEKPGKIVTREGKDVKIIYWDRKSGLPIVTLVAEGDDQEMVQSYTSYGSFYGDGEESKHDLVLQIPEWAQFKEGDILACEVCNENGSYCKWFAILEGTVDLIVNNIGYSSYATYDYDSNISANRLTYDDYPDNIDSIRLATEEEKQMFIKRLQEENTDKAKYILKRFFGVGEVEEKPKCEFEPFQKVLVRGNDNRWGADLFSHFDSEVEDTPFICVGGMANECIPYNEETKHLLGTTDDWEE